MVLLPPKSAYDSYAECTSSTITSIIIHTEVTSYSIVKSVTWCPVHR